MSYLLNHDSNSAGVFRAVVINKYGETRVFIPGHVKNPLNTDGTLNVEIYDANKLVYPIVEWCSNQMKSSMVDEVKPCWITYETGDIKRPIVMGYFGKGLDGPVNVVTVESTGDSSTSQTSGSGETNTTSDNTPAISIEAGDILLVAGHGAGDPGACGSGYQEANLTREVVAALAKAINASVFDTSKNMHKYLSNGGSYDFSKYKYVFEIHFNSYNKSANGSEILVHVNKGNTSRERRIVDAVAAVGFSNRGIKTRNNLGNMNRLHKLGIEYSLLEVCFIDNASDMNTYKNNFNNIINAIAGAIK